VRSLATSAGIDLGRRYKDQSITKLAKLMLAVSAYPKGIPLANIKQAREAEPYLANFEDDWATGQILRQYINGKQKYENAKANGRVRVGEKRKRTSSASPIPNKRTKRLPSPNDEVEWGGLDCNSNNNDEHGEDEVEWTGFGNLGDESE
jgi:hypothetical protein